MKSAFSAAAVLVFALLCVPAQAQSEQEGQRACGNDVFALCQAAVPDRGRITACLRAHYRQVSQPCRTYMASYGRRHVSEPRRAHTVHHHRSRHSHHVHHHRRSHDRH